MDYIRMLSAIWICKLLILIGKAFGKKGSSTPGRIALFVYPNILTFLSRQVKKEIIVVCGTNGKTTTNNLIYSILIKKGYNVICNNVGANMLEGVATAFIDGANLTGMLSSEYACIELDEASAVKVFDHFIPSKVIITNLFRDQLDRYGEIDIAIELLTKALCKLPNTVLLLNGDDPLVARFGRDKLLECYYFGIDENVDIHLNETKEGRFCTFCGEELIYNYYHYSQLGDYRCPGCGFARPVLDFRGFNVNLTNGLKFQIADRYIDVDYRGFYNIYNILAAYSAITLLGIDTSDINDILMDYKPQIGRMEQFFIKKPVILNLSKNPAGFNQAISTVLSDTRKKDILIVINDNAQDGKDISWIWDVDFERMNISSHLSFIASGTRADDVMVRLKYAGIEVDKVTKNQDMRKCIIDLINGSGEVSYLLINYTALFDTQNILLSLQKEGVK